MISKAIGYGVDFPAVYDWTWGEVVDFINSKYQANRERRREEAEMHFHTVSLLARMFTAEKGAKFNIMDAYDFLWTKEEIAQAKAEERKRKLEAKQKVLSLDEQDRLLSEMKKQMLEARE